MKHDLIDDQVDTLEHQAEYPSYADLLSEAEFNEINPILDQAAQAKSAAPLIAYAKAHADNIYIQNILIAILSERRFKICCSTS